MSPSEHPFATIDESLKRAVAALNAAEIPFLLGGSVAIWAHGGPETRNDLDFMVRPEDAERALEALVDAGMRPERPAEDWLLKAWDGDVLIDIIHRPMGMTISDEVIARGRERSIDAVQVRVMAIEDVLTSKLLALGEHSLDLEGSLQLARALREQIDWGEVRLRTEHSPYARAFLHLIGELGVVEHRASPAEPSRPRVRVVR